MKHCLAYQGGFERNFRSLKPGKNTFEGTDGNEHPVPATPPEVDGVRISYMEKAGKKFTAVRVQYGSSDVVVGEDLLLSSGKHLPFGKRFAPEPTIIDDESAAAIIDDLMSLNPSQRNELAQVRSKFSVTAKAKKKK